MSRTRLSHDDAMTLWAARDAYRIRATIEGLVILFFVLEYAMFAMHGAWFLGLVVVGVQVGALWAVRWALRWALRSAARGVQRGVQQVRQQTRRTQP